MGYDDYDYDNVEYRPAKAKKPLPKTPRARAAALRRINQAKINYENRVAQVGTYKQHINRMKTANLRKLGQMNLDDFMNFSRGSEALEKFTKKLKK
jgi:hypothetical protein